MNLTLPKLHMGCAVSMLSTLVLSTGIVYADTSLTYTESHTTPVRLTQIQIHQGKVRMQESGSHTYLLFDDQQTTLYNINLSAKQYITTTPRTLRERAQQTAALQRETQAALTQQRQMMPDAQREAVEAQSKTTEHEAAASITLTPTTQEITVAKLPCTLMQLKVNEQVQREICQAKTDAIPKADLQTLVHMFNFLDKIAAESAKAQGKQPPVEGTAILHEAGLALSIKAITPGGYHSELTEWDMTTQLDAEQFTLPTDFRKFEPSIKDAPPKQPIH